METYSYLCAVTYINIMKGPKLKITFMDMACEFILSLPEKVQKKITYDLLKIKGGEIDKELFKKLENSEI